MADKTHIEWTDATWNPITGCSVVSPGCTNCYAMKLAGTRLQHHPSRAGPTVASKAGPVWTGEVRFNEQWLDQPLRWKKPRMIFVCAHGDLFHENVPDEWIDRVFAVMATAPHHTFQVLTKRPERMRDYMADAEVRIQGRLRCVDRFIATGGEHGRGLDAWPLHNVWLGVSAEDQTRADERIPLLLATPAAVRSVSAEPLLGPVDLTRLEWGADVIHGATDALSGVDTCLEFPGEPRPARGKIDWVICGGESGPGARPMHPDWARSLRDQCAAAGVAFHFKQWGEWVSVSEVEGDGPHHKFPDGATVRRIGKKAAGRHLDGVTHDAYPAAPTHDSAQRRTA